MEAGAPLPGAGGPAPSPSPKNPQAAAEEATQHALAVLHQLHCSISTFSMPSQLLVLERLNNLVTDLQAMSSAAEDCTVQVPIEVINLVDEGKNPDEFTKALLNNCVQRNQATKGKVDAFKEIRKHLLEEVEDAFPEETEAYRQLRTASALESRRALQASGLLSNGDIKVKTEH